MPTRVLDPSVAAKIAAGEVVERPVSVVKELLDNSIDAGADRIEIEIKGGGIQLIKVSDNGAGISSDEVILAFSRHATSKIASIDDLNEIKTLGFRGEALPSIAAVSHVTLATRTDNEEVGVRVDIDSGIVTDKRQIGCPGGTVVDVKDLFRKVPARLKFLKSNQTESGRISNLVSQYCLAYPEIKIRLSVDGKVALDSPGNGALLDAITAVYGVAVAGDMIEIADETGDLRINGYVSRPSLSRSNRSYISLYVNRRWVKSQALTYAVEEAYSGLLVTGRHPIAMINVYMPYSDVDVNVHPAKTEVRFQDERALFAALQKAVRASLTASPSIPQVSAGSGSQQYAMKLAEAASTLFVRETPDSTYSVNTRDEVDVVPESDIPILRVVGQIAASYVLAEGPDGLYIIDHHAAHERILYEKIKMERERSEVEVQGLLELITMELTPHQQQQFKGRSGYLTDYGFDIEPFGDRTYLIRSVPSIIAGRNVVESTMAVIDSLGDTVADWDDEIAISLACHGAIKAGQTLSMGEMRELVGQLEKAAQPYNCPHGRPTMIRLNILQLEKEFKRR